MASEPIVMPRNVIDTNCAFSARVENLLPTVAPSTIDMM